MVGRVVILYEAPSIELPPCQSRVTITPAMPTPTAINPNALRRSTPKTNAARAPLHAPVMGNGMATKVMRARSRHRSNLVVWRRLVWENSRSRKRCNPDQWSSAQLVTGPRNSRMKGTGSRFPTTASTYDCHTGMSSTPSAKGMAPRSSNTGKVASNTTARGSGKLRTNVSIESRMVRQYCRDPDACHRRHGRQPLSRDGLEPYLDTQPASAVGYEGMGAAGRSLCRPPKRALGCETGLPGAGSANGPVQLLFGGAIARLRLYPLAGASSCSASPDRLQISGRRSPGRGTRFPHFGRPCRMAWAMSMAGTKYEPSAISFASSSIRSLRLTTLGPSPVRVLVDSISSWHRHPDPRNLRAPVSQTLLRTARPPPPVPPVRDSDPNR